MSTRVYTAGVLREQWDDATRTYTAWTAQGALVTSTPQAPNPRPYTAAENTQADLDAAALAGVVNGGALTGQVGADLATLRVGVDTLANGGTVDTALAGVKGTTNATINGSPAQYIKTLTDQVDQLRKELRRADRQIIALSRLVTGDTSSADTGTGQ